MQGNTPWYTPPPQSALNSDNANSNYFYNNYNQNWSRAASGGYDSQYYNNTTTTTSSGNAGGHGSANQHYPMNNNSMRTCAENYATPPPPPSGGYQNSYDCQQSSSPYYRHGSVDYGGQYPYGGTRNRHERIPIPQHPPLPPPPTSTNRAGSNPVPEPGGNHASSFDNRLRNQKSNYGPASSASLLPKTNDAEDENFSSVFTQSLTSLYSQDVEGNFADVKTTCDVVEVGSVTNCPPRLKTEDVSSCSIGSSEYSFSSTFESTATNPNSTVTAFDNVKIKTEPYDPQDSPPSYNSFTSPVNGTPQQQRRRGTLAEAYSRKRKHSMPSSSYCSSPSVHEDTESPPRSSKLFQSESQWIPNSLPDCQETQGNGYGDDTYPTNYNNATSGKTRGVRRQAGKTRGCRRKLNERKLPCTIKKFTQKKVSPLTVYTKLNDNVIVDVTCRRYKRRSRAAEEAANELSEECGRATPQDSPFTWQTIYREVGEILHTVVDRVSKNVNSSRFVQRDLSRLPPASGSELLYKFCRDYHLDYRDFKNFYDIIETDVTKCRDYIYERRKTRKDKRTDSENTQQPLVKMKRRRSVASLEDFVCRRSERVIEKEPKDTRVDKSIDDNTNPPSLDRSVTDTPNRQTRGSIKSKSPRTPSTPESSRILRNLPSRQPTKQPKKSKKTRRNASKNRYPKRNLRGGNRTASSSSKKPKILIDLSKENGQTEVLEVDSDSSVDNSTVELDAKEADDEPEAEKAKTEVAEKKSSLSTENPTKISILNSNIFFDTKKELKVSLVPLKDTDCLKKYDMDDAKFRVPSPASSTNTSDTEVKVKEEVEAKDEDSMGLMQPPQLVRMTDSDSMFADDSQGKSTEHSKEADGGSFGLGSEPRNDCSENDPPTLHRSSESSPDTEQHSSRECAAKPEDEEKGIAEDKMKINEKEDRPLEGVVKDTDQRDKEHGCNISLPSPISKDDDTIMMPEMPAINLAKSPERHANDDERQRNLARENESVDDDPCQQQGGVDQDSDKAQQIPTENSNDNASTKDSPEDDVTTCNILRKTLLEAVKSADATAPGGPGEMKSASSSSLSATSGSKNSPKTEEQDESILRTLLLESEVVTGNSFQAKDAIEFPEPTSYPVTSKAINLSGRDNLVPQPPPFVMDMSKVKDLPYPPPFFGEPQFDINESSKTSSKFQSYDAYIRSLSPETYEAAQKQFKDNNNNPAHSVHQVPKCEMKEPCLIDPKAIKDKMEKLNSEISYLQVMADQKEKEKVAILCFKRYKEAVYNRTCKEYAMCVQDRVRDWIYSKRENSATDNHGSSGAMPPANTSGSTIKNEASRLMDQPKTVSDRLSEDPCPKQPGQERLSSPSHRSHQLVVPQPLAKPRSGSGGNSLTPLEKVSTVETMVAKANDNYGLDMSNLRDRLKSSPDSAAGSGILQKVLSSSRNAGKNPNDPLVTSPWSSDINKRPGLTALPPTTPASSSKTYPDHHNNNIPIDMIINGQSQKPPNLNGGSSSSENRSPKIPDSYRNVDHSSSRSPQVSVVACPERVPMPDPVNLKTTPRSNPYRSWSIQTGGRITEDRSSSSYSKPQTSNPAATSANVPVLDMEVPVQRQLNPHKSVVVPRQPYSISSPTIKTSPYDSGTHRSPNIAERSAGTVAATPDRNKNLDEDRRSHAYAPGLSTISSNSAMPYGGHIIPNTSPLTPASVPLINRGSPPPTASSTPLCMGCGLSDAKFLCSGCRKHWYCSAQCQSLRWPEHSRVCSSRIFSQSPSTYS